MAHARIRTPSAADPAAAATATADGGRLRRPSGIRSVRIGDLTVTHVPDGVVGLSPRGWLPGTTDEVWAAHPEYLDEKGELVAGIGGLLVEHGDRALLIDAGFGPLSVPARPGRPERAIRGGALLDNLAALGRDPARIEAVAFTHLHVDHIGWAWYPAPGTDAPAFTGAEYLVAEAEWAGRGLLEDEGTTREMTEAMAPRVRTVADGEEVFPGVRAVPTPGHTSGHTTYVVASGGERLIVIGDALHSSIQVEHPEWSAAPDVDPVLSARHRAALVAELAGPGTIGYGGHFADVVFGTVHADGGGHAWRPVSR